MQDSTTVLWIFCPFEHGVLHITLYGVLCFPYNSIGTITLTQYTMVKRTENPQYGPVKNTAIAWLFRTDSQSMILIF